MWRKLQLIIVCGATVVATGLIITTVLILFGRTDLIELYFYLHFSIGAVIVFIIFWPYYSKKMKLNIED
jgi:uncharacterized membrane protein